MRNEVTYVLFNVHLTYWSIWPKFCDSNAVFNVTGNGYVEGNVNKFYSADYFA